LSSADECRPELTEQSKTVLTIIISMNTTLRNPILCCCLAAGMAGSALVALGEDVIVKPARGGGLDTNAPMIHVDIFYDYAANQMHASLDTTKGVPNLVPLPSGFTFDVRSNYSVLNGKAHNFQYAWNPGGIFTNPPGAAIWIECLSASPELECYDGPGNKMLTVPRSYAPIFGTGGCSTKWPWYGAMAHNSYAVLNPTNSVVSAQYRIYFGDAQTGAPDAYAGYGVATVTLMWTVDAVVVANPARGGGLDTNAPMIHCDVFYDYSVNQMHATLDTSKGVPTLTPLPASYTFDSRSNYAVLNGKAYNFQYAWNPGGIFTNPPGAAIWIECLSTSPELECYDGPGNKMLAFPRSYAPIFGTAGSPAKWCWYGAMAHNSYAVLNPTNSVVSAQYHIYFGDSQTGAREAYTAYGDTTVTLSWNVNVPVAAAFVTPMMGGGQVVADMDHIDLFYDTQANQLRAQVDDSMGTPQLLPLEPGYAFDPQQPYAVLNGKAYNAQYGWNVGGLFSLPPGTAIWIELLDSSPGLETYSGSGQFATYAPILGTAGSPRLWKWSGVMVHNTYATFDPATNRLFAEYHVYLGDMDTGSRANFMNLGDTTVRLEWTAVPTAAPLTIDSIVHSRSAATARFFGRPGRAFYLERCSDLRAASWQTVAGPVAGTNKVQALMDPAATEPAGFYRLLVK
jgi:hypothetical protein